MVSAVNSWLWYRRHYALLQENKPMTLYTFISNIASGLVEVKANIGRPLGNTPPNNKRALAVRRPAYDVRQDGESHLPDWSSKRQRCTMNSCDSLSYIYSVRFQFLFFQGEKIFENIFHFLFQKLLILFLFKLFSIIIFNSSKKINKEHR